MPRATVGVQRTAYATSAVAGTVCALVALLAVSLYVSARGPDDPVVAGATAERLAAVEAGGVAPGAATGGGSAGVDGARAGSGGRTGRESAPAGERSVAQATAGGAAGRADAGSGGAALSAAGSGRTTTGTVAGQGGPNGHGGGAATGSGGPTTGGARGGAGSGEAPRTTAVRPAAAGRWPVLVDRRTEGALPAPADGQSRGSIRAFDPDGDGSQRFDGTAAGGIVAGHVARLDDRAGRLLASFELADQPGRRFVATGTTAMVDVPATWRAGDQWRWTAAADDGATTVEATSTVVGRESAATSTGEEIETVRVDTVLVLAGDRSITAVRRVWFAPALGIAVRVEETADGTWPGGAQGKRTVTLVLEATQPAPPGEPPVPASGP